jgi:hypothetical protein
MRIWCRSQSCLLTSVFLFVAWPAQAAEIDKYLPDDTGIVGTVNVKQIMESPLVKKHALDKLKGLLKEQNEVTTVLDALGFDPFKDLTSITTAVPTIEMEPKAYMIAHGQFDIAKFEAKAKDVAEKMGDLLKIHKEGNHTVYEVSPPDAPKPLFVGLVDKTTIVGSHEKDFIIDSFARAAGQKKSALKKEVQDLIEKVDGKQSLWFVVPGEVLAKAQFPGKEEEETKKHIERIESVTLSFNIGKDVKLSLSIAAKNADSAKEMAEDVKKGLDMAKGFLPVIVQQEKRLAPLVDIVGAIKVETEGKSVTISSEVSEELIEKGIKDQ